MPTLDLSSKMPRVCSPAPRRSVPQRLPSEQSPVVTPAKRTGTSRPGFVHASATSARIPNTNFLFHDHLSTRTAHLLRGDLSCMEAIKPRKTARNRDRCSSKNTENTQTRSLFSGASPKEKGWDRRMALADHIMSEDVLRSCLKLGRALSKVGLKCPQAKADSYEGCVSSREVSAQSSLLKDVDDRLSLERIRRNDIRRRGDPMGSPRKRPGCWFVTKICHFQPLQSPPGPDRCLSDRQHTFKQACDDTFDREVFAGVKTRHSRLRSESPPPFRGISRIRSGRTSSARSQTKGL